MDVRDLERRIEALPEAAQREIEALVSQLERDHTGARSSSEVPSQDAHSHPFVGMWAGRDDVTDSVEWVRTVRERQWGPSDE